MTQKKTKKVSTSALKAAVAPKLKKAREEKERVKASRDCLKHELCPKCGKKMKYKSLPRGQALDYLVFYGQWTCRACKLVLDTLDRANLLDADDSSFSMWLDGEIFIPYSGH